MAVVFHTRRFAVRDYVPSDEAAFVACQTDPVFARFHRPNERGEKPAREVFARFLAWQDERPRRNHQFAVTLRGGGGDTLIGSCGVRTERMPPDVGTVGLELARRYQGRYGYAIEIGRATIDWAFAELRLAALVAETEPANAAIARLLERAGFRPAGADDRLLWRLDRGAWSALR
jgi:RimJ/RimL family protein N-acetyltransferase